MPSFNADAIKPFHKSSLNAFSPENTSETTIMRCNINPNFLEFTLRSGFPQPRSKHSRHTSVLRLARKLNYRAFIDM